MCSCLSTLRIETWRAEQVECQNPHTIMQTSCFGLALTYICKNMLYLQRHGSVLYTNVCALMREIFLASLFLQARNIVSKSAWTAHTRHFMLKICRPRRDQINLHVTVMQGSCLKLTSHLASRSASYDNSRAAISACWFLEAYMRGVFPFCKIQNTKQSIVIDMHPAIMGTYQWLLKTRACRFPSCEL